MNYLLANIQNGKNIEFLKVLTLRSEIIKEPNLSNTQKYSSEYKLEDDEWFELDNFLSKNYTNGLIEEKFNGTTFNQIEIDKYKEIKYLCVKQNDLYLFQKMSKTQLLYKSWFKITNSPTLQKDKPIIVINECVDAVYNKNKDTLYFKDIIKIKQMFKGIDNLYRTATQAEVDNFLSKDFILLGAGFTSDGVKTANRKRIAMAIDTLNAFEQDEVVKIVNYIKQYCSDVPLDGDKFIIEKEEHLKLILYGIEQRYYTTQVHPVKRLANSVLEI